MFVSWTSFIDNKYSLSSNGQAFIPIRDIPRLKHSFLHITLGEFRYPNTLGIFNPNTNTIDLMRNNNISIKSLLKADNSFAVAVYDINNDGYSEILITHNEYNATEITLYYFHILENKWKYKKIKNPYPSPNASITVIPNGFLVSNSSNPPFLVKWDSSHHTITTEMNFSQYDQTQLNFFTTRAIVNYKGLIKNIDGFILNGNPIKHLLPEDTFKQYRFILQPNHITIKPWIDSSRMNATSVTFVNINPIKKIYGFLIGNWAQESYLYMFKHNKFIKKHIFPVSYCTSVVAADFDNDGKDEIFFANGNLYNTLYKVHDENNIEEINVGEAYTSVFFLPTKLFYMNSAVVADLDKDGFLELFTTTGNYFRYTTSWFKVYMNARYNYRYLRIYPQNQNLSPATGSIVKIKYLNKTYKKIIDNGGSSMSQNEPIAHFGIGTYTGPIRVTIIWTDGSKTRLKNVSSNQVVVVIKK